MSDQEESSVVVIGTKQGISGLQNKNIKWCAFQFICREWKL